MPGTARTKPQGGRAARNPGARPTLRAAAAAAVLGLALTGCAGMAPAPAETPAASTTPAPGATAEPAPTLQPEAGAAENLAYFDLIASGVVTANPVMGGVSFVDALAAAGFDKAQMEVTFDRTAADLAADSIQVAVRLGDDCLIGQNPATGGYRSAVAPVLGSGTCLLGTTRQIDW